MRNSIARPLVDGQQALRRRNWLLPVLIVALVLALLVSLAAIGGYFLLSNRGGGQRGWQDPLAAVDPGRVRSDIAVITLLGENPGAIVREALAAGEPDTAYSVLVYHAALGDAERSGNLLLVAKSFEAADEPELAAVAYQQIHSIAALSPSLPDVLRAESSLQAAEGFMHLGLVDAARPSLAQAEALARYSPLLAPVKRRDIAQALIRLYREAGFEAQADGLAQLVLEAQELPDARLVRGPFLPTFQSSVVKPQQLLDAEEARRREVRAFLVAWDASNGQDVEAARAALASALLQEDGVHQAVVAAELEAATQLSPRAAWLQERINWLTLKLMVAGRGLGINLVPEWALQIDKTRAELNRAYTDLFVVYGDQAASLPQAGDAALARVEILRREALVTRLGLDPYRVDELDSLAQRLDEVQREVANRLTLLVVQEPWADGLIFRLSE